MNEPRAKPFLKWAGGKGQLLAQYAAHFPQTYATYYEPFCGGGAVFFHLAPAQAVISDINPELVNVYICVRDAVDDLIAALTAHAAQHSATYFYAIRAQQPSALSALDRAARLIYLNRTCFNGLYRENSRGQFNVPLGRYANPTICNAANLRAASITLRGTTILRGSFDHVLDHAQPGDLVYFDPPYFPLSATSSFTTYSRDGFGIVEQERLCAVFAALARRGVRALISNSDCAYTRTLYTDFRCETISAGRAINTRAERRGKITELLVMNW